MMKKKMKDQLDVKNNNIDKSPENKENTANSDTDKDQQIEYKGSVESTDDASDALEDEVTGSDKVLPEVKAIEEKLAEMQDKYIRLSAEFDNYRKRTLREKMDLSKYAGENLLAGHHSSYGRF